MILTHIKTVLVDFDGTLIDSNGCWIEAYQLLCEQRKTQPSAKIINVFAEITFDKWQDLISHTEKPKEHFYSLLNKKSTTQGADYYGTGNAAEQIVQIIMREGVK